MNKKTIKPETMSDTSDDAAPLTVPDLSAVTTAAQLLPAFDHFKAVKDRISQCREYIQKYKLEIATAELNRAKELEAENALPDEAIDKDASKQADDEHAQRVFNLRGELETAQVMLPKLAKQLEGLKEQISAAGARCNLTGAQTPPPNLDKLKRLLRKDDKVAALIVETEALRQRLEAEIDETLQAGESLDEKIAQRVVLKRTQLELIPAKLRKLEAERGALKGEITAEFPACRAAFERQFAGLSTMLEQALMATVRKFLVPNVAVERCVATISHSTTTQKIGGIESAIRFTLTTGDCLKAAQILIARADEAELIVMEAQAAAASIG